MTAISPTPRDPDLRGVLVSVEGINGVGKTYLTQGLIAAMPPDRQPLVVEEFSRRRAHTDAAGALGRSLLRALVDASDGDRFLRGGRPRSETLLLLAVKLHDFEITRPALLAGRSVIEGRSAHSVAVYQSLILEPDDDQAIALARQLLAIIARWRPLPDLTVLVTDDPTSAIRRAETRDGITYTPDEWRIHRRAESLFEQLAAADPNHVRTIDRREHNVSAIIDTIRVWMCDASRRTWNPMLAVRP